MQVVYELDLYVYYRINTSELSNNRIEIRDSIRDHNGNLFPSLIEKSRHMEYRLEWAHDRTNSKGLTLPAVVCSNGANIWLKNGRPHNDDLDPDGSGNILPAMTGLRGGSAIWFVDGKWHNDRKDKHGRTFPAEIYPNVFMAWYNQSKMHNSDVDENGRQLPAIVYVNGARKWRINGNLHNASLDDDGNLMPAVIHRDRSVEYHVNGIRLKDNRNPFPHYVSLSNGHCNIPDDIFTHNIPDEYIWKPYTR
jgi:hypothetical protein